MYNNKTKSKDLMIMFTKDDVSLVYWKQHREYVVVRHLDYKTNNWSWSVGYYKDTSHGLLSATNKFIELTEGGH